VNRLVSFFYLQLDRLKKINVSKRGMILMLLSTVMSLLLMLLVLLIVVSCQTAEAINNPEPIIENVRGYLYSGPEVRAFRECNSSEEYWVTGNVDSDIWKLYDDISPEEYMPVYVEMKVQYLDEEAVARNDYVGDILLKELYHLAYESKGCESGKDYDYLLQGNAPFWTLLIDEQKGVFMQEMGQAEVYAKYEEPAKIDNGVMFKLNSGSKPMVIKIRKIETYDTMSGSYYAYSSYVRFDGKVYYGQALIGAPFY